MLVSLVSNHAMSLDSIVMKLCSLARFACSSPNTSHDAKKAALKVRDKEQRDWDGKVLSYDELKPRTQQPQPVSLP